MKRLFVMAAVAALCISCAKNADIESGLTNLTFSLGQTEKTTLNGSSVLWQSTDCLSVFDKVGGNRKFTTSDSGDAASFSGAVVSSPEYTVLYPYFSGASLSNGLIKTEIPVSQKAVSGSFASGANLSCCILSGESGLMKNVCALVKLTISPFTKDIASVTLESNSGEALSGGISIAMDGGVPVASAASSAVSYVNLDFATPVRSGTYYIAVCPGTLSSGLKISFRSTDGKLYVKSGNGRADLIRGDVLDLGTIDLSGLQYVEEEPDDTADDIASAYASYGVDFKKLKGMGHPRLFMTASDFETLKERVITNPDPSDPAYMLHCVLIKNADSYAASSSVAVHELVGKRMLTQSRNALQRMFHCAYAYRMTGQEKYLTKARTELAAVSAFPDWNSKSHFLDPSEMALAVAVAYDWLYYDLTLEERKAARAAMVNYDLTPFKTYKATTTNNWNQVCNGGAIAAALVTYEKNKALAAYDIDKAIASNLICVDYTYNPNGNGIEGNGYWNYAMSYQIVIINALETAFGSSCGIGDCSGMKKTGLWKLYMCGSTGGFNFSDSGSSSLSATSQLIWLAARYNLPELMVREWAYLKPTSYSTDRCLPSIICGLVRYPVHLSPSSFPTSRLWTANDLSPIVLARQGWKYDESDKYFGLKGGGAFNNHSHMDAGHFVYDAFGIRWAWDTSMGDYNSYEQQLSGLFNRGQKSSRWDILCQNNYYHNTLSFTWADGSVDKWHTTDQVVGKNGSVLETYDDPAKGLGGKVDLSCYYTDAASSVTREMRILGEDLKIIDVIKSKSSHSAPFEWRMLTKAAVSVEDGYIALTQNGKTVYLYSKAEGDVSSSPVYGTEEIVRPSSWTPRTWDTLQSYAGFHVVKFSASVASGSKTATFTTVLSPLKPSESGVYPSGEVPDLDDRTGGQW